MKRYRPGENICIWHIWERTSIQNCQNSLMENKPNKIGQKCKQTFYQRRYGMANKSFGKWKLKPQWNHYTPIKI